MQNLSEFVNNELEEYFKRENKTKEDMNDILCKAFFKTDYRKCKKLSVSEGMIVLARDADDQLLKKDKIVDGKSINNKIAKIMRYLLIREAKMPIYLFDVVFENFNRFEDIAVALKKRVA